MKYLLPVAALLGAVPVASALAQDVTNNGATITLTGGAVLTVGGSFSNNGGTLDLSNGANTLNVGGNLANASGATLAAGPASTISLNGTAAQQLNLNGAILANLTINNTNGGVMLPAGSNATVAGALTLTNGMLTTDPTSTLTLAEGATLAGEQSSRYVAGNLAAAKSAVSGATTFPNGVVITPAAALGPLTVTRTAGLNTAQISYGTDATGKKKGIDQIWQTSTPLTNATVQLAWLAANDNGLTNLATSQVWARETAPVAGSSWVLASGAQNASSSRNVTGTVPAARSFSFFTVSTTEAPLPVALVSFAAERTGDAALLTWRTASELNNDRFEVEASVDGQAFRKVGQVAGHGTTFAPTDYSFSDPHLLAYAADLVYYRLRQVDASGAEAYSPVRTVRVEGALAFALAAFPNPLGTAGTHLQVRTGLVGPLMLTAYDATGRALFTRSADLQPGATALELPEAGQLTPGVYYVRATQAGQHTVLKLTRE